MKKFIFITASVLALLVIAQPSFGQDKKESRKERRERERIENENFVKQCVTNKDLYIRLESAHPLRGMVRNLTYNFTLSLKSDTLTCRMPYLGQMHTAVMDPDEVSFVSYNQKVTTVWAHNDKKDSDIVQFIFVNTTHREKVECTIEIFKDAMVYIGINSNDRDTISYKGVLCPRPQSEE